MYIDGLGESIDCRQQNLGNNRQQNKKNLTGESIKNSRFVTTPGGQSRTHIPLHTHHLSSEQCPHFHPLLDHVACLKILIHQPACPSPSSPPAAAPSPREAISAQPSGSVCAVPCQRKQSSHRCEDPMIRHALSWANTPWPLDPHPKKHTHTNPFRPPPSFQGDPDHDYPRWLQLGQDLLPAPTGSRNRVRGDIVKDDILAEWRT